MKILVAGATGAIGRPLVRRLMAAGDQVTGIARSARAAETLHNMGAAAVRADVLDREALLHAVTGRRFDAVIHELTELRKPPARYRDMAATNRLRTTGTRNLLDAAECVGATRFVTQSIVFGYGYTDHGDTMLTEADRFGAPVSGPVGPTMAALSAAERQVFDHPGVEGIALRYGLFYGGDIAVTTQLLQRRMLPVPTSGGRIALVHHDDAAEATAAALRCGRTDASYNIVDETPVTWRQFAESVASVTGAHRPIVVPGVLLRTMAPYAGLFMTRVNMTVSNERARQDLGWAPKYPSYRDGIFASVQAGRASTEKHSR